MTRPERWLWGVTGLLAAAVAALFLFKFLQTEDSLPVVSVPVSSCDLQQGSCSATFSDLGSVIFTIAPRPIPLVEPLDLVVETAIAGVSQVEVDFSGVDMNMGYNRFKLKTLNAGRYEGEGMLPVCVRSRMTWEAKVMLKTEKVMYVAPFRFDTVSRR